MDAGGQSERTKGERASSDSEPKRRKTDATTCPLERPALSTTEPSCLIESQPSEPCNAQSNINHSVGAKDGFPFLKLPAELRVHVYRMAFQRDEPLILHPRRKEDKNRASEDPAAWKTPRGASNGGYVDIALLRTCALVYKEARQVLYAENTFALVVATAIPTLSILPQRSRSLIRSVILTVPAFHDILDAFSDVVRLGLRYCWGLKKLTIVLDSMVPEFDGPESSGTSSVYGTTFHILRFLPKGCKLVLEGHFGELVRKVVMEEGRLLEELDETSHLKRQHQMGMRDCW